MHTVKYFSYLFVVVLVYSLHGCTETGFRILKAREAIFTILFILGVPVLRSFQLYGCPDILRPSAPLLSYGFSPAAANN